jgi:hypothetical protein
VIGGWRRDLQSASRRGMYMRWRSARCLAVDVIKVEDALSGDCLEVELGCENSEERVFRRLVEDVFFSFKQLKSVTKGVMCKQGLYFQN